MNDEQLLRYNRQIMLPQIDVDGQEKLMAATALILGLGGLGCPVAMYLAAAGVGKLILIDDDVVELSNLQRQVAHFTQDIGKTKVESARQTVNELNPEVSVELVDARLDETQLNHWVLKSDIVIDCSDNFQTRFMLNRLCFNGRKPLVSGAAIQMEGQISVFDSRRADSPCYQCLYKNDGQDLDSSCALNGVVAPLVGVIGSVQALETVKIIASVGEPLVGRLLLFDAMTMQWRSMKLPKDPECQVCGHKQID